ncbi:hypothetical protein BDD43_3597 [Mucilaginibacter gracilis]|uniref:DUF4397 domain-containing protein n=1 Tax=Mucilaginibacter gracilis TaxID=423350 RepID=A0A495J5X3_9SPHI|nr:hypothetical protein [Mucilaginibacter gracilis]RKR83389.1 hypothetical protein BDD43_3597 [Mucilaginibacter gracilis]
MKHIKLAILILTMLAALFSCKKEELRDEKYYYGNLKVSALNTPDLPDLSVYYDDDFVGTLKAGSNSYPERTFIVDNKRRVRIYLAPKGDLVADTTITMIRDKTIELVFAYSELYGISGFTKRLQVSPDSAAVQLYNKLPASVQPNGTVIDAHLVSYDPNAGGFYDVGIYEDIQRNKFHPKTFLIPALTIAYIELVNRATGAVITDENGTGQFYFTSGSGANAVAILNADETGTGFMFTSAAIDL